MPFGSGVFRFAPAATSSCAGVEQSVARREVERRQATRRRQLFALRWHAAADDAHAVRSATGTWRTRGRLRAHTRAGLDRCAAREQELRDRGAVLSDRPHQRGVTQVGFRGIHLRASIEEHGHRIDIARAHCRHQQGVARRVGAVGVGARLEQPPQHGGVAVLGGDVDRRDAEDVGRRHFRARANQRIHRLDIVRPHAPVQRGRAVRSGSVDVVALFHQRPNRGHVPRGRRAHEGALGRRQRREWRRARVLRRAEEGFGPSRDDFPFDGPGRSRKKGTNWGGGNESCSSLPRFASTSPRPSPSRRRRCRPWASVRRRSRRSREAVSWCEVPAHPPSRSSSADRP